MSRIAVFNQKSGVGKTTTVFNLAAAMHHRGNSSLLIDIGPQSHLTKMHQAPPQDASRTQQTEKVERIGR